MEVGRNFKNIKTYNKGMSKSLSDKLFFLNHLPKERDYLFVDFGCADGILINSLYEIYKNNCYFIGYDISEAMIGLAKSKFNYPAQNVNFTSSWNDVERKLNNTKFKKVLILSSVIHEIYSYANSEDDITNFWDKVISNNFDYICIRDMMCSDDIDRNTNLTLLGYFNTRGRNVNNTLNRQSKEFEYTWGDLNNNKNFIHFLLKYRYTINWDRELHENYFPIYIDQFINRMLNTKRSNYSLSYFERFRVPFLEKCWNDDFGISIEDYTHVKMIFELLK